MLATLVALAIGAHATTASAGTPPVAAYSFDEGVGTTAHDLSGTHNGEVKGAKWVTGKFGSALEFSPSTKDLVTIPSSEDLRFQNFTLEAWVNSKESRKWAPIIAKMSLTDYGYGLYMGGEISGDPQGMISNQHWTEAAVYKDPGPALNTWTHLAVTNDGTNLRLYINGTLVATEASTTDKAGTGPLEIGGSKVFEATYGTTEYFAGKIDEVRLYNRALNAEEIVADSNTPVEPYSAEINVLPTIDAMNRTESNFSNGGKWSALAWDNSNTGHNTGQGTTVGWGPWDGGPLVNGAYWNPAAFTDKPGSAAEATVQVAGGVGSPVSIWLDMPSPGTTKSGYQLHWTKNTSPSTTYTVKLSKWSAGSETVLATNNSISIASGTTLAISDGGGIVSVWQGTSGSVTSPILSANDSTFSSGYAGIEGVGNATRTKNFKAGPLPGSGIGEASVLDNLERSESPLNTGKWTKTNWAGQIGGVYCCSPYRGYGTSGGLLGSAYWNQKSFSDAGGAAPFVSATVGSGATPIGQYLGMWLDMPSPGSARSGYEARFEGTASNYKVQLSKWVSGTRTVLATKEGFSLPVGTVMALTESAGSLVLWTGKFSLTPLLSASDTTYGSGYAGLEVSGSAGTEYNFKAGAIAGTPQPPDTTISSGSSAGLVPPNVAFSFTGTESPTSFECSLDGGAYSACTSPKSYSGLSESTHTFKVRGVNGAGADASPAERAVEVVSAEKALTKTALLDNLERSEHPLAKSQWSKDTWAASIGGVWITSFKGFGVETGGDAGAYWNNKSFSDASGAVLVTGTVGTGPTSAEGERLALWLNTPSPGTVKSGYEARYERVAGGAYKAEISKWVSGTRTVLATKESFSLSVGETMGLSETGGNLTLWAGKAGSFSQVATANDSTYSSGYAGLEVKGGAGTIYNFRAGQIDLTPPDTFITVGPSGKVPPGPALFYFGSTDAVPAFECSMDGASFTSCGMPKEYKELAEGSHTFKVRAFDPSGNIDPTPAERTFQIADPPETTITSSQSTYKSNDDWPVTFVADEAGSTFECSVDGGTFTGCTSPYSVPSGLSLDDWHTFRVRGTDTFGNTDPTPAEWTFKEGLYPDAPATSKLVSPEDGKASSHYYTLKSAWDTAPSGGGVTGVTYQVKLGKQDVFRMIPAQYVLGGDGEPVKWPLPAEGNPGETPAVFFDYTSMVDGEGRALFEKEIWLRAVFDGGPNASGASAEVAVEFVDAYDVGAPSDSAETIGPVKVDLLTGQYTISRTDVSIPIPGTEANLEFARTYESTYGNQNVPSMALGGMWQPAAAVEKGFEGEAWVEVRERHTPEVPAQYDPDCIDEWEEGFEFDKEECLEEEAMPASDWIEVLDSSGAAAPFEIKEGKYVAPEEMREYSLTKHEETFELTEPGGVHTVFVKNSVGLEGSYRAQSVSWAATSKSVRMVYDMLGEVGQYRLSKMIAPAPSGVECSDAGSISKPGCRTLELSYFSCNCDGWSRLQSIKYYNASGDKSKAKTVAEYEYDPHYRLIKEWDPRVSPALKESYYYGEWGWDYPYVMQTLTPPGEEPWEFGYYEAGEFDQDPNNPGYYTPEDAALMDRLKTVSRDSLTEDGPAISTFVYQVPIDGEAAPYDMGASSVAEWGQTDYPVDATAVFPPTDVPDDPHPADYSNAAVHYLDPDGNEVNAASPSPPSVSGDTIVTSETDVKGNVVRYLDPQNRLAALASPDPVTRSHELDTHTVYSADGTEALESWGPLHKVRVVGLGETIEARTHVVTHYDQGAPTPAADEPWPHLPTEETTSAYVPGKGDYDSRTTQTTYDWSLRLATEGVVDPSGLNLRSKTIYNEAGQTKEVRQPSDTEGTGSGATRTVYYTAASNSENGSCGFQPAWAGLPCVAYPVAPPSPAGSNPQLPWTWFTKYSELDQPEEVQEKTNGVVKRTTTVTYDAAGRVLTVKQSGEGNEIPAVETTYSPSTGGVVGQHLVCVKECASFDSQEVTTSYDTLGRVESYKDADGNVATATFDLIGRPVVVSDSKGSQTTEYDEQTGLPVQVVDSAAGTFTANYNADGDMVEQQLPNGMTQKTTFDSTGSPTALRYEKQAYCGAKCTWLEFSQVSTIHGQVVSRSSNLSSEEYDYDRASRLVLAKQTFSAGSCTTRAYAYDKDSNRTSVTTRGPKAGGACDTESAGTKQSSSYDTADRLTGTGIIYDSLGRTLALPSAYSGGGTLTTSYYVNDQIRSQSQDGITNTYALDSTSRQRERTTSGSQTGTEIYHYSSSSDSPSWIQSGSSWTRNFAGLGPGVGGIQNSSGNVTLQLANLHGDIVATADINPTATALLSTQNFDEFGVPLQTKTPKYGWLGGGGRRTELPSGVVQMGVRSYVPGTGRFLSPDPVAGGSASAYDYANADPVNQFDLSGETPHANDSGAGCTVKLVVASPKIKANQKHKRWGRMKASVRIKCMKSKLVVISAAKFHISFEKEGTCWLPGRKFCVEENCKLQPDCMNVDAKPPDLIRSREFKLDQTLVCEAGVEYQMQIAIPIRLVTGAGVIVSGGGKQPKGGKGTQEGSPMENEDHSFVLKAQEVCGHGGY